jgi:hypothetical protein
MRPSLPRGHIPCLILLCTARLICVNLAAMVESQQSADTGFRSRWEKVFGEAPLGSTVFCDACFLTLDRGSGRRPMWNPSTRDQNCRGCDLLNTALKKSLTDLNHEIGHYCKHDVALFNYERGDFEWVDLDIFCGFDRLGFLSLVDTSMKVRKSFPILNVVLCIFSLYMTHESRVCQPWVERRSYYLIDIRQN